MSIIVAGITYVTEAPERTQEKNYQAWQAINTAQGQGGSGGRIEALQDLNNGNQSLVGVSVENAFLQGIDLENAKLDNANFQGATLNGANLREASLKNADLEGVILSDSASDDIRKGNLQGANLEGADAREADLAGVDLQGAQLKNADMVWAVLDEANLQGANLRNTVLDHASLTGANLQRIDFQNADLWYADLSGADLRGASNLTQKQVNDALGSPETQIPEGLHVPSHWKSLHGPLSKLGSLPPGDISTTYFSPQMSFRLGKGWVNNAYESGYYVELGLESNTNLGIYFLTPEQVYDPRNLSSANTIPVPNDIAAWMQDHPYMHADEPIATNIGGIEGRQFDVEIPTVPEDYPTELCESPCVPVFVDPFNGTPIRFFEGGYRVTVLSVQGETVVIVFDLEGETPARAEELLKSLEWKGV